MVSAPFSDPALAFAVGIALAALASALLLVAATVGLRIARHVRQRRLGRQRDGWRTALLDATEDAATPLPRVDDRDLPAFLATWNHLQETLRGEASTNLAGQLQREGFPPRLMRLLERRSLAARLVAITALGHLREVRAWRRLARLAADTDPVLSFAAARAMLRIEPRRALSRLLPAIARRDDWSLTRSGSILQELGPDLVTPPILVLLARPPEGSLERLLKLARLAHREAVVAAVRSWLGTSSDPDVLTGALDYVEDGADLPWVRGAARHPHWRVRMASARALLRIGNAEDLGVLLGLLQDPVWWVRYHAAQAIVALPGVPTAEVERLRRAAQDAFAGDMLGHALAENAP